MLLCVHMFRGRCADMHRLTPTKTMRTTYAKFPLKTLFIKENANSQSPTTDPAMRWIATTVPARPFATPNDRLLGTEEEIYMCISPDGFAFRQRQHAARRMGWTHCIPSQRYRMRIAVA